VYGFEYYDVGFWFIKRIAAVLLILTTLLSACNHANPTDAMIEDQNLESAPITRVSWKAVDYGADFFHLYVTLDGDTDYYVGYYFGENFDYPQPDEGPWNADVPESSLSYFRGMWTGAGECFYMYRKTDAELAVMNHHFAYGKGWDEQEEYKEILVIHLVKDNQIQMAEPVIIRELYGWRYEHIVYDGLTLGRTKRWFEWVPSVELEFDAEISRDMGYRLFENGQYIDTVAVSYDGEGFRSNGLDIQYNGEIFQGLAVNNILPMRFGEKTLLDTHSRVYRDCIAQILSDNGLEGEPVNISEIIETDIEDDGKNEVLIVASNIDAENKVKGQYSIVVLIKTEDVNTEFVFIAKEIIADLPTDSSGSLIFKYKLCEVADLNYDDICELLMKKEDNEGYCYQVYELADNEFKIVLESDRGN